MNSFSRDQGTHQSSNNSKLESFTPEDALARAFASQKTPKKFNLKFNQNSTTRGSEEKHFSYFSNVEEDGTSELGDYFSDDEEDDTWDREDLSSESNPWSHTDFNDFEPNFKQSQTTLSEWDPVISGLETINEARVEDNSEADKLNHISGFSEETKLAFSTWRPFIPPQHAFQNCAAHLQPLDFLSQASSSQEPTLIQISTITASTKPTPPPMRQTSPRPKTSLLRPKDWPSLELTTRPFTPTWTKYQTESKRTSNSGRKDFPDHPEPSKQCKPWKQQSRCSTKHIQNQNTRSQNTPPGRNDGDGPQGCTPLKLQNSSITKPKRSTTKIKYWGTQWRKFSSKTPICQTKLPKNIRPLQRHSRRITQPNINTKPEWPDLQNPVQPPRQKRLPSGSYKSWRLHRSRSKPSVLWEKHSTFLHTQFQKISKHKKTKPPSTGNISSKRRSESESHYQGKFYRQQKRLNTKSESENDQHKTQNFKNVKVKAMKKRKVKALMMIKAKSTAKVNEVKAIEKTLTGFRIESETTVTLPSRFTAMFNISILIYILTIFIFKNLISISNLIVSDLSDHPFQTFTVGELSDCKTFCLSQQTASIQAETLVNTLANSDSRRLFKIPGTRPDLRDKNLSRNPCVPSHTPSG